jgi:hypothetical protein
LLGNELIDSDEVLAPFASELLQRVCADGRQIILIIDQTRANDTQQAIVVAARVGGRSLPIAWRVKETQGAIGFPEQKAALEVALALLPEGARVVLMGDRFYGSPDLIAWCRKRGWDWRLRLKADLLVFEDGGESTLAECFARGERMLNGVELTAKRVATNIGMVHENGHPEPWFIAMSDVPTTAKTFDYGLRWGDRGDVLRFQEPRFRARGQPSAARGSHGQADARHDARALLGRFDWDVDRRARSNPCRKKDPASRPKKTARSLTSFFKRGLRRIQTCLQNLCGLPKLWSVWRN